MALESGFATNKGANLYNNPYSLMYNGKMIKYDNYHSATASYFNIADRKWPTYIDLIRQESFSADAFNKAYHIGSVGGFTKLDKYVRAAFDHRTQKERNIY